jgi:hypothetical protein
MTSIRNTLWLSDAFPLYLSRFYCFFLAALSLRREPPFIAFTSLPFDSLCHAHLRAVLLQGKIEKQEKNKGKGIAKEQQKRSKERKNIKVKDHTELTSTSASRAGL